jgi:hypothetical protein
MLVRFPTQIAIQDITVFTPLIRVDLKADQVCKRLKNPMRMHAKVAERNVDRKVHRDAREATATRDWRQSGSPVIPRGMV